MACLLMLPHAHRHDVANHNRSSTGAIELESLGRERVERASPDLLFRIPAVHDDRRRRAPRPAAIDEGARDGRRSCKAHQHDNGDAVRLQLTDG